MRPADLPPAVSDVLRHEGLTDPVLLGAGEDAMAFARSVDEVIRVFPHAGLDFVRELADLYAALPQQPLSFRCPQIHEVRAHGGVAYAIEARLPGRPMEEVARDLDEGSRRRLLENYLRAIRELGTVELQGVDFGGLIPSTVWHTAETWSDFLAWQLHSSLERAGPRLAAEVPGLSHTVTRLESMFDDRFRWDRKCLVHGDAYPGNVLVTDSAEIAAILDFGRHSLAGDPRLDVAIAIELTEMAGFTPQDTRHLRALVDDDPVTADGYRALTAILLAAEYRGDERIVRRCLESLRATSGRL